MNIHLQTISQSAQRGAASRQTWMPLHFAAAWPAFGRVWLPRKTQGDETRMPAWVPLSPARTAQNRFPNWSSEPSTKAGLRTPQKDIKGKTKTHKNTKQSRVIQSRDFSSGTGLATLTTPSAPLWTTVAAQHELDTFSEMPKAPFWRMLLHHLLPRSGGCPYILCSQA